MKKNILSQIFSPQRGGSAKYYLALCMALVFSSKQVNGQIKLLTNGNVGVGTTTPEHNFEVFGTDNPMIGLREPDYGTLQIGIAGCNGCYSPFALQGDAVFRKLTAQPTTGGTNNLLFTIIDNQHLGAKHIKFTTEDLELFTLYDNQKSKFSIGDYGIGIGEWNNKTGIIPLEDDAYYIGSATNKWTAGHFSYVHYNSLVQYSDLKLKKNVNPLSESLTNLLKLKGHSFNYNSEKEGSNKHFGFIAQEIEEIYPELVLKGSDGILSVKTTELIPVLVEAIKEQQTQIQKLNAELSSLTMANISSIKEGLSFDERNKSVLYDCQPNPFSSITTVKFKVARGARTAKMVVVNLIGETLMEYDVIGFEKVEVDATALKAGAYIYSLFVDGKEIESKKMLVSK